MQLNSINDVNDVNDSFNRQMLIKNAVFTISNIVTLKRYIVSVVTKFIRKIFKSHLIMYNLEWFIRCMN